MPASRVPTAPGLQNPFDKLFLALGAKVAEQWRQLSRILLKFLGNQLSEKSIGGFLQALLLTFLDELFVCGHEKLLCIRFEGFGHQMGQVFRTSSPDKLLAKKSAAFSGSPRICLNNLSCGTDGELY
jgi:hypothetical protein